MSKKTNQKRLLTLIYTKARLLIALKETKVGCDPIRSGLYVSTTEMNACCLCTKKCMARMCHRPPKEIKIDSQT